MPLEKASRHLGLLLAAAFSAWASYRIHVLPIEDMALPILAQIVDLQGRAPDQYRVLPYLLIGALHFLQEFFAGAPSTLRYPVLVFDCVSLFAASTMLRRLLPANSALHFSLALLLLYPYLMFDGYRPISAFILFLSVLAVLSMKELGSANTASAWRYLLLVLLLSASRADVALMIAAAGLGLARPGVLVSITSLAIPLLMQGLLQWLIFPEAEYFSAVVMVQDNLSGRFLFASPLTWLLAGLALLYLQQIRTISCFAWRCYRVTAVVVLGYVLTLFIVARPNEYRLFLPMLPVILLLQQHLHRQNDALP
jgi:hypothetical protein